MDNPYLPSKGSLANQVRNETMIQLKKEKELYPIGVGDGIGEKIRMLAISFRYYKEVDIDEARELLLTAGTVFLKNINANEKIRPFLKNDPFGPENIEIRIFINNPNGSEVELGKLTVISLIDGILEYDVRNPITERLTTFNEELFEEAVTKLSNQSSKS